jgi:DNA-binding transcriptional LysR family regulator
VLPADHPLAARRVELADLAGEPWIGSEPPGPCLDVMLDACTAAGFTPNIVARSEDYPTAQGFVAGLGIALVPSLGLAGRRPGVAVRPVRGPEPVRAIHAATREAGLTHRALRTLLEALEHAARA